MPILGFCAGLLEHDGACGQVGGMFLTERDRVSSAGADGCHMEI